LCTDGRCDDLVDVGSRDRTREALLGLTGHAELVSVEEQDLDLGAGLGLLLLRLGRGLFDLRPKQAIRLEEPGDSEVAAIGGLGAFRLHLRGLHADRGQGRITGACQLDGPELGVDLICHFGQRRLVEREDDQSHHLGRRWWWRWRWRWRGPDHDRLRRGLLVRATDEGGG
jgi:hypothetical protein